jgi:hypothetical protein
MLGMDQYEMIRTAHRKCREGDVVENIHFTSEWFIDKRRAMPRQARLDAPGTLYHVMIRGIEGKSIFRNSQDGEYGISLAGIARRVVVCTPAIAKAIQKIERKLSEV